jgi:hypothetical protein
MRVAACLRPRPFSHVLEQLRNLPREREQERQRVISLLLNAKIGNLRDDDALARCGTHINLVRSRAETRDDAAGIELFNSLSGQRRGDYEKRVAISNMGNYFFRRIRLYENWLEAIIVKKCAFLFPDWEQS